MRFPRSKPVFGTKDLRIEKPLRKSLILSARLKALPLCTSRMDISFVSEEEHLKGQLDHAGSSSHGWYAVSPYKISSY